MSSFSKSPKSPKKTMAPADFARMLEELEQRTSRELAETRARFHRHQACNSDGRLVGAPFAA